MFRRFLLILLFGCAVPATAADYSDIWYIPAESGWGINFAQNDAVIFATLFVYAENGSPTWYGGILNQDSTGKFSGNLFNATGPFFGAPTFDSNLVAVTTVGSMTFTPTATDQGVLTYSVGTRTVTKTIQRQTLTNVALGGTYLGGVVVVTSQCSNTASNSNIGYPVLLSVTQVVAGTIQLDLQLGGGPTCTIRGTGSQAGQLFRIPTAQYTCTGGLSTTAMVYEMKSTALGIEGRWVASTGGGCQQDGRFSAVF